MSKAYIVPPTYSIHDGRQISVAQLLAAREQRANIQRMLINKYQFPILSLTLVIPGKIKQSSAVNFLFDEAMAVVLKNVSGVRNKITCNLMTGPESFFIISNDAMMQKKTMYPIRKYTSSWQIVGFRYHLSYSNDSCIEEAMRLWCTWLFTLRVTSKGLC